MFFKGEEGSYSEEAAFSFFKEIEIEPVSCNHFDEVFRGAEEERDSFGVVPIENTLIGSVGEIYNYFVHSPLFIYGEKTLRVDYCLIAPGKKIERVYIHPDAIRQCKSFLEQRKLTVIPSYRPMESLKILSDRGDRKTGAIFSERAAERFNMNILEREVEIEKEDFTRFLILSRRENLLLGDRNRTSIIFQANHNPGALVRILNEFSKRGINLTKLESRPIIGYPWAFRFFMDFEGHKNEERVEKAFQSAEKEMLFFKILGSYPV